MVRKQTLVSDWKAHYAKLKTQVTAGISDQKPILAYIEAARFIPIGVHMNPDLSNLIHGGLRVAPVQDVDEESEEEAPAPELSNYEEGRFKALLKIMPGSYQFRKVLENLHKDDLLVRFIKVLDTAVGTSRASDTKYTKPYILDWILEEPDDTLNPAIPHHLHKSVSRGHFHQQISRLLVPLSESVEYEKDPQAWVDALLNGELEDVNEGQWPQFLYPTNIAYDENRTFNGLFRGFIIPRAIRGTLNGWKSAFGDPPQNNNDSKIHIYGIKALDPHIIAYCAAQAAFALLPIDKYGIAEPDWFCVAEFYQNCADVLSADKAWAHDTISYLESFVDFSPPKKAAAAKRKTKRGPRGAANAAIRQMTHAQQLGESTAYRFKDRSETNTPTPPQSPEPEQEPEHPEEPEESEIGKTPKQPSTSYGRSLHAGPSVKLNAGGRKTVESEGEEEEEEGGNLFQQEGLQVPDDEESDLTEEEEAEASHGSKGKGKAVAKPPKTAQKRPPGTRPSTPVTTKKTKTASARRGHSATKRK